MASPGTQLNFSPNHPPELVGPYEKARRAYGAVSALLLAWEFVGIDVQPTPIESLNVTLKSPQATPYVLIAFVLYFAFRLTIEWHQSAPERRRMPASRVDFWVAHSIGILAIGLYGVQRLLEFQLADRVTNFPIHIAFLGFLTTWTVLRLQESIFEKKLALLIVIATLALAGMQFLLTPSATAIWALIAGGTAAGIVRLGSRLQWRRS